MSKELSFDEFYTSGHCQETDSLASEVWLTLGSIHHG